MSSKSKQRWNAEHYTQVKVQVKPEIAEHFKSACIENGESQAQVLTRAMLDYTDTEPTPKEETVTGRLTTTTNANRYGTRRKRRKAIKDMIDQLEIILAAEETYRDNIPTNFTSRYETADECITRLNETIDNLRDTYQIDI